MATDPRFTAYVAEALAAVGIDPPKLDGNKLLLQVADRWLEVVFNPADARLVFVGIVALGDTIRADLLGQFNVYNLFHGGYSLISPPGTGCVYLTQSHAMARLPAADLLQRLADFEERAGAAGTWYLTYKPEPVNAVA